jgi:hypothetical protein
MDSALLRAFQQVPMEVVVYMAGWARSLPTLEERGGAAQAVNHLVRMRDPQFNNALLEATSKPPKGKALHG